MNHPHRIQAERRHPAGSWLTRYGWATVFILAGVFFGTLAILAGR